MPLVNTTFAQFTTIQAEAPGSRLTTKGDNPLLWYKKEIKNNAVSGNTNLLQTKTAGTNKSEVVCYSMREIDNEYEQNNKNNDE